MGHCSTNRAPMADADNIAAPVILGQALYGGGNPAHDVDKTLAS
ncbi:MAG: hypothetical protein ETSY2_20140 [Candidatus Entotheonella gemina]|uniref:Uncharacterized protein n=1 Tax=Candidatus Entotheonella gemina TaxID=1429439 RepID=W4M7N0_9BACT|nr:MAG: hypothetical protein ETSY2_20140 [Candidatus Entotheonella gemina]